MPQTKKKTKGKKKKKMELNSEWMENTSEIQVCCLRFRPA